MTTSAAGSAADHQHPPAAAENTDDRPASPPLPTETADIIDSLREAAAQKEPGNCSELELSLDLDLATLPASDYWDASTMASLNAVSAVSIARIPK